eukprot:SAG11_NODE_5739_length_1474_cov_1.315636_1_plen_53_part_10
MSVRLLSKNTALATARQRQRRFDQPCSATLKQQFSEHTVGMQIFFLGVADKL